MTRRVAFWPRACLASYSKFRLVYMLDAFEKILLTVYWEKHVFRKNFIFRGGQ